MHALDLVAGPVGSWAGCAAGAGTGQVGKGLGGRGAGAGLGWRGDAAGEGGGDRGGTGRPWEPVQAASGKLKFEDVSSEMQKKCEKKRKTSEKRAKKTKTKKKQKKCKNNAPKVWGGRPAKIEVQKKAK